MATAQLGPVLQHLHSLAGPELSDGQLLERFAARRDEAAFASLLQRHGWLVWSVCRRVLRHEQDAEDAFQATFLVLARHADAIRRGEAVSSWLYHVAYRVALRASQREARRHACERQAGIMAQEQPGSEVALRELQTVIAEELRHLPEKYQAPFVLCCLEGKSKVEAARELGWKEGTVSGRLAQARKQLLRRLARRGVLLSAVLCSTALASSVRAALPAGLLGQTVEAGLRFAAGGVVRAEAAALAEGVARALFATRLKLAGLAFVLGIVLAGAGLLTHQALAARPENPPPAAGVAADPAPRAPSAPKVVEDLKEIQGRVFGPDGKPFAGARLVLPWNHDVRPLAVSGADGRFRFTLKRTEVDPDGYYADPWPWITVIATASGYGPDWHYLHEADRAGRLTLRLVPDDVPIAGRILDLQGQPVAGATVRVERLNAADDEKLDLFLKQWSSQPWDAINGGHRTVLEGGLGGAAGGMGQFREIAGPNWRRIWPGTCSALFKPVQTDKDGRFRLSGFGRERLVELIVQGPAIEQVDVRVVTRMDVDAKALGKPGPEILRQFGVRGKLPFPMPALYGARFEHHVGPTKPLVGTVRDKETGKPLAGVRLVGATDEFRGLPSDVETITDVQGCYRLVGLPKARGYSIRVETLPEAVHLPQLREVDDTEGLKPIPVDFELTRGIVVEGRLLDQATGRPVIGTVDYAPLAGNPAFDAQIRGGRDALVRQHRPVGKDGKFRILAFPGPGVVFGFNESRKYLSAVVRTEDKKRLGDPLSQLGNHFFLLGSANVYRVIEPAEKAGPIRLDLEFLIGKTVTGSVVGPDGKPVGGARAMGLTRLGVNADAQPVIQFGKNGAFTAVNLDPRRPGEFVVYQAERQLAGRVRLTGDETRPVTVRLERLGKVKGRVLDSAGRPLAGVEVQPSWKDPTGQIHPGGHFDPRHAVITTDKDGRFEMEGLLPGVPFELAVVYAKKPNEPAIYVAHRFENLTWKPGETKDLGTVRTQVPAR
jgi:RNA polymerase sigma factor (sigma-70 family)